MLRPQFLNTFTIVFLLSSVGRPKRFRKTPNPPSLHIPIDSFSTIFDNLFKKWKPTDFPLIRF